MAISKDDLSNAPLIADDVNAAFPILYDPAAKVIREYGVYNLQGDGLAAPSTFVIDSSGVIRWKYVGSTGDRPSADEVLKRIEEISG